MTPWPLFLVAGIGCCALVQCRWRRHERRCRRLVQDAPVGIAIVAADGHLQLANPAFHHILGAAPGRPVNVLTFPPLVEAGIAADLRHGLQTAVPLHTERAYTGPTGRRIRLDCRLAPLPGERTVLALFEEIAADKCIPENPALQRLAAGVAHDLNNHLTVIHAYVDLLALNGHAGEHQALTAIRQAARDIGALAGQLLAFSHQPLDQPLVSVDLNRLIDDTRDLVQLLAGKGTVIELRLAPDLRPVTASPGQMARVLVALSTHAPCATSGGRTLTFETANTPRGVALSVTDTGLELDQQAGTGLFEPFAQGGRPGLGLATAHAIVTRHGGQIAVTRAPQQGTTFTVYLPAQKGSSHVQADLAR